MKFNLFIYDLKIIKQHCVSVETSLKGKQSAPISLLDSFGDQGWVQLSVRLLGNRGWKVIFRQTNLKQQSLTEDSSQRNQITISWVCVRREDYQKKVKMSNIVWHKVSYERDKSKLSMEFDW